MPAMPAVSIPKLTVKKASVPAVASTPILLPRVDLGLQLAPAVASSPPHVPIVPSLATSTAIIGSPPKAGTDTTTTPTGYPDCKVPPDILLTLNPEKIAAWQKANCVSVPQQVTPVRVPLVLPGAVATRPIANPPTLNQMGGKPPSAQPSRLVLPPKLVASSSARPAAAPSSAALPAFTTTPITIQPPVINAMPDIVPVGVPSPDNTMPTGSAVYAGNAINDALPVAGGVPVLATDGGVFASPAGPPVAASSEESPGVPSWVIAAGIGAALIGGALLARKKRWL